MVLHSTETSRWSNYSYSHTLGIASFEGRGFMNPVDVRFSEDGYLYVLSRSNAANRNVRVSAVTLDSEFMFEFANWGTEPGLSNPTDCDSHRPGRACLPDRRIYAVVICVRKGRNLLASMGRGWLFGRAVEPPVGLGIRFSRLPARCGPPQRSSPEVHRRMGDTSLRSVLSVLDRVNSTIRGVFRSMPKIASGLSIGATTAYSVSRRMASLSSP